MVPTSIVELLEGKKAPEFLQNLGMPETPFPTGAVQQRQTMTAVKTMIRHPIFGSQLTALERKDFNEGYGALKTGDVNQARDAYNRIIKLYNRKMSTLKAGADPDAWARLQQSGKIPAESYPLLEAPGMGTLPGDPQAQEDPNADMTDDQKELMELLGNQ